MSSVLLTFKLVNDKENIEAIVNPKFIETIVDAKTFVKQDVTQITMTSGTKFFVAQSYEEVKDKITKQLALSIA